MKTLQPAARLLLCSNDKCIWETFQLVWFHVGLQIQGIGCNISNGSLRELVGTRSRNSAPAWELRCYRSKSSLSWVQVWRADKVGSWIMFWSSTPFAFLVMSNSPFSANAQESKPAIRVILTWESRFWVKFNKTSKMLTDQSVHLLFHTQSYVNFCAWDCW